MLWDAFSNAGRELEKSNHMRFGQDIPNNQRNLSSNGFLDTSCSKRWAIHISVKWPFKLDMSLEAAYGTKIAEAVAPASFTASATVAKTGRPRCVCPAFLGFVPPTTFVPKSPIRTHPSRRLCLGTRTVLDSLLRMETGPFWSAQSSKLNEIYLYLRSLLACEPLIDHPSVF